MARLELTPDVRALSDIAASIASMTYAAVTLATEHRDEHPELVAGVDAIYEAAAALRSLIADKTA